MRLVSKTRHEARLPLTIADIFRHPILSRLANVMDHLGAESSLSEDYMLFSALGGTESADSITHSLAPLITGPGRIVDAAPTTDFQVLSVNASLQPSRDLLALVNLDGTGPCDIERWKLVVRDSSRHTIY